MSGRKQSEVLDVLQQGKVARDYTGANYDQSFVSSQNAILSADEKLKAIIEALRETPAVGAEAKEMYGSEVEHIKRECDELERKLKSMSGSAKGIANLKARLEALKKELASCDREGDAIRAAIAHKYSGYCDAEYDRAQKLKTRYQKAGTERKAIDREISNLATQAQMGASSATALSKTLSSKQKALKDMNIMAQNRKMASSLKEQLQTTLASIDKKWARKFMEQQLELLGEAVNKVCVKTDAEVVAQAPMILSKLNSFVTELDSRVATYQQQKSDAEDLCEKAEQILDVGYVDPMDYGRKKDAAKPIELFEYIAKYKETVYGDDYERLMDEAAEAMDAESFLKAQELYKKAYVVAQEARDCALDLQENMIKTAGFAFNIQNTMHELGYNVKTTMMTDGNPADGFRIVASAGGEKIDFEITYDKDGKPVMDIDHQEAIGGSCGKSWDAIVAKMRSNGLPVADITKNGKTVLGKQQQVQKPVSPVKKRETSN